MTIQKTTYLFVDNQEVRKSDTLWVCPTILMLYETIKNMYLKFIFLSLIFCNHFGSYCQSVDKKNSFTKKVKMCTETTVMYHNDNTPSEENKFIYLFNIDSCVTKETYFYNNKLQWTVDVICEKNRKKEENTTYKDGSKVSRQYSYEYDSIENKKTMVISGYAKYIYYYDKNGNLRESFTDNLQGDIFRDVYTRNSKGWLIESVGYKNSIQSTKSIYEYDSKGNCIKYSHYSQEVLYSTTLYTYYDNGEEKTFNDTNYSIPSLSKNCKYEYEYNSQDKWVKKITFDLNDNLRIIEILTRDFEYY